MTIGVLFVCTANICRSPMAEGVFRTLAQRAGLEKAFTIASAGTTSGHAGEAPTPAAAADYVLAMDRSHMADLRWMAPRDKAQCLQMFTKFGPMSGILDVQDPYGGTQHDYERALDLIEAGCKGLLAALAQEAKAAVAR